MPPPEHAEDEPRFALRGRIVTMDPHDTVLDDGVLYIGRGLVDAVLPAGAPRPPGHEDTPVVRTGGTVYPGLIELHNHLPYDVLPLWRIPERYGNRSDWGGRVNPAYRTLVTGPMTVLGEDPALMPAVVRYVEAKALVNGTTTSQGIALFSNTGSRRMYRGIVRNVEATDDPALPEAASRIADVEASDASRFLTRLQQPHRLLLHLAEGVDDEARGHFRALEFERGRWAITDNLVGIHCTALTAEDFTVFAGHGGSMVWSPLSNLLLYGRTADIAAARRTGMLIGLGSDWSVSGSKGLLGELKAARLASAAAGGVFSDRDLVAMATRDAAAILRWERTLGSLRPGTRADLITVAGDDGDPYTALIDARDRDIVLVAVDGTPRYGTTALMRKLTPDPAELEPLPDGAPARRSVRLHQSAADPVVGGLTLTEAAERLSRALTDLPSHAERAARRAPPGADEGPRWRLALDEIEPNGTELRPRLAPPAAARRARPGPSGPEIAPLDARPAALTALALDGLTAGGDPGFLASLAAEPNLPPDYAAALSDLLT
ncbi:amidohydrolase family protein [Streptomyces sp. NPDC048636]|uniref:amidohydrolase family protein n=1 Tax=Streptomyces sp. NPDC048636 TaxID=3155762 RepID=UPI003433E2ED